MVVCSAEHGLQADVLLVIEATAVNGAYLNDIKSHYIIPALEWVVTTLYENLDLVGYSLTKKSD